VASAFFAAGVRTLHLETCLEPRELQLALQAISEAAPELLLWVSFTLNMGHSGPETPLGVPLSRMLRELERAPALPAAVGVNCSQPARRLHAAVGLLDEWAAGRLPILVKPQVGDPAPDCRVKARPETPERFARDLLRLCAEGVAALGGCCGTTGEHLRAVRQALDGNNDRNNDRNNDKDQANEAADPGPR
jgi:5-methyltetrahydrofolate--homocysteine methyltransferase